MRHTRSTRHTRRSGRTTGLLAAGLLLTAAACGDDSDADRVDMEDAAAGANPDQFVDDPPANPDEADQTDQADPTAAVPEEETIEVGAEFWYSGFRVDVEEARLLVEEPEAPTDDFGDPTEPTVTVEVETVAENIRHDDIYFPADEIDLSWAGESVTSQADSGDRVREGSTARIVHLFEVDETFTFDDATVTAGGEGVIQPVVPLAEPDTTFTAAPILLEGANATEPGTEAEIEITDMALHSSRQWDGSFSQMELDRPALGITASVHNLTDEQVCAPTTYNDFRLELPDGTEIGVLGNEIPGGCLQGNESTTDINITFELEDTPFDPDQLSGETYALVGEDARAPFELTAAPGQDAASTGGSGTSGTDAGAEADSTDGTGTGDTGTDAGSEPAEAGQE